VIAIEAQQPNQRYVIEVSFELIVASRRDDRRHVKNVFCGFDERPRIGQSIDHVHIAKIAIRRCHHVHCRIQAAMNGDE